MGVARKHTYLRLAPLTIPDCTDSIRGWSLHKQPIRDPMVRSRRRRSLWYRWRPVLDGVPLLSLILRPFSTLARASQAEASIVLTYPEPYNQGRFLGFWLSFRLAPQLLGGTINLGLNARSGAAGKVAYTVYIVFVILQALTQAAAFLLTPPRKVQRTDGRQVKLEIQGSTRGELVATVCSVAPRYFTPYGCRGP